MKTSQYVHDSEVQQRHLIVAERDFARERKQQAERQFQAGMEETTSPDDGRDRMEEKQQWGIALTGHQLMQRLRRLNPNLIFEPATANGGKTTGVYYPDLTQGEQGRRYLGVAFDSAINPEFHVMGYRDPERKQPFVKQPGWRSVVARLARAGVINLVRAEMLFGPPSHDSLRWKNLTQ